jgi:anti-sigma B factor antagonist
VTSSPEPPLRVDRTVHGAEVRLALTGGLDLDSRKEFLATVEQALILDPDELLIDVADLTYCDSAGLQALVASARRSAEADTEMRIVGVRGAVQRLFDLVDMGHILNVEGMTVDQDDEVHEVEDVDEVKLDG